MVGALEWEGLDDVGDGGGWCGAGGVGGLAAWWFHVSHVRPRNHSDSAPHGAKDVAYFTTESGTML